MTPKTKKTIKDSILRNLRNIGPALSLGELAASVRNNGRISEISGTARSEWVEECLHELIAEGEVTVGKMFDSPCSKDAPFTVIKVAA